MTRRVSTLATVMFGAAILSLAGVAVAQPPPADYAVIVSVKNPIEKLGREDVSALFLKRVTRWGEARSAAGLGADFGSVRVEPVDQRVESSVRALFSVHLLGRSVDQVESYWARVEAGDETVTSPPPPTKGPAARPPVLDSDAAVQEYVAAHPGAIGYVSGGARLIPGVKKVEVRPAR